MYVERHAVTVTSIADGTGTAYSPAITGRIVGIRYVKASSGSYTDGVDVTITLEATGETVMVGTNVNASTTYYPRVGVTDAAGAAATLDGTRLARDCVYAANDRVKFVLADAGDTKTGVFHVIVS